MAQVQSIDSKFSFIFVGDLNAHHRKWLCSVSPINDNGYTALDFASLAGIIEVYVFPPVYPSVYYRVQLPWLHIYQMFPFVAMCF